MSTFYSRDHNLIFIHVPKCAGTTINSAILAAVNRGKPTPALRLKRQGTHTRAVNVRKIVGERDWERCWSFGVVRNPWERLVSFYAFLRLRERISGKISFQSWLVSSPRRVDRVKRTAQSSWLCDGDRQIVDTIFRFEHLDKVQKALSEHLGQRITFAWYKKTDHGDYPDFYDARTRAWVERVHAEDIERFGYEF